MSFNTLSISVNNREHQTQMNQSLQKPEMKQTNNKAKKHNSDLNTL